MKRRVVASIEARMGSSRLPGKVLADVAGKPALTRLLTRLRQAKNLDGIILATSTAAADDVLEAWAKRENVSCYRGSVDDVLLRVVQAHRQMDSDVIVEVTGDCTLIDPEVIDWGISLYLENSPDVASNTWKLSFPMGVDVQVFARNLLEEVERTQRDLAVREHVSLYFYEHPEKYKILHLMAPPRWLAPEYRFQLDYPEDHLFLNEVYRRLEPIHGQRFGLEEVLGLLKREPELAKINRSCVEKSVR